MKRPAFILILLSLGVSLYAAPSKMVNVVCFVRFADEPDTVFIHKPDFYDKLYNDTSKTANSVFNYFSWSSYRQFEWTSLFYPVQTDTSGNVMSFKSSLKRGELQPYNALTNPIGYKSYYDATCIEHDLVRELGEYLDTVIPDSVKLDWRSSGTIDNLTVILSGNSEKSSSKGILWPHQDSSLLWAFIKLKNHVLSRYLVVFDNANGFKSGQPVQINTGVLCHEMTHVLGAPDLYTLSTDNSNPVGTWDLMSDNNVTPQGMTAYTRWKYGKWIDDIPQITADGDYELRPVGSETNDNVAYRIVASKASSEFFMLEYRKQEGTFESGIPSSGLICYRISDSYSGNLNGNGKEMYIFRQNATSNWKKAAMSADIGITEGNTSASPIKFKFSDGKTAPFSISNVGYCNGTISFHVSGLSTGLEETVLQDNPLEKVTFNLYGQPVDGSYRGIVIIDGKKHIQ